MKEEIQCEAASNSVSLAMCRVKLYMKQRKGSPKLLMAMAKRIIIWNMNETGMSGRRYLGGGRLPLSIGYTSWVYTYT